ncbi:uncharacterized protein LOC115632411 isoform X4 [Scaptodrosophila lebanonensis]|uniref:Uncharacterized protein LOC115632411 isoform X4 n=1 Tax=Drosophila lebanonensis TaxID=7225 RepID=A0A6J2UA58_DROLE|nr:uncharacterized protein LOC115632411 isoform X4 [Scaptodrosophila lebanonensis]
MLNSRRSASVGALPHEKKHFVSRVESASGASLDVRCACQYFQCDSLLPERVNPVDSRPGSKLGYHSEAGEVEQFYPMNLQHRDDLSAQSFEVISHSELAQHPHHHQQQQQQHTQAAPPPVDLSFVERYPELEQTARSRGLVVRSISDANEADMAGGQSSFMAGHRRRQLSVGGLSSSSIGRFRGRDIDTLSMRSGTSLRRISAANSKADLYCADINIPGSRGGAGQRSASASRRASNADLFQANILPSGTMQVPQLNLIAATPSAALADVRPDFHSHQASPAPSQDFRNARRPLSPDYMRPSDEVKAEPQLGDVLPQNRPIDVSRFHGDAVRPSFLVESDFKAIQNPYQSTVVPNDPLAQTVAELEEIAAAHDIVNIRDNIQSETHRPPSIAGELSNKSLHLDEQTKIEIKSDLNVVNINELVRSEQEKAEEAQMHRSRSPRPSPRRPKSSPVMATLQLPSSRPSSPTQTQLDPVATTQQQQLKRQHAPERQLSPERPTPSKMTSTLQFSASPTDPAPVQASVIPLQQASPEVKSSYASRFKSMFSNSGRQKSPSPQRVRTPSPKRERSPSLWSREKEKSPSPSKMLTVFAKNKPVPMSIVSSTSNVMKKQEPEPLSVRVTETFSLKVDEMDQYCTRPSAPLAPPSHAQTLYSSREDFAASERASVDISEAFAPVVVSALPRGMSGSGTGGSISSSGGFMAGNRNLYSSEIEMPWAHSESEFRGSSKEPSIASHGSRPLISVPINISGSRQLGRAPSMQRLGVQRKSSFREPRTLSHDRAARLTGSQEHLYGSAARMTKTVSFNFDERKSRLAEFESSSPLTQKQYEHRDFLERTYFSRDHEYEPIGVAPTSDVQAQEPSSATPSAAAVAQNGASIDNDAVDDRYLSSAATTPRTESRTDYEIHTSQVDSSALEELPLQPENRKKGFMATAQDRTRKMQDGIRNQAGKIRTKLRPQPKKPVSGSPKAKERRRFKAPEFSKIKMPEIKRPDMTRFKDMKRPEFTKFNKPDMSKFKLPEKFPTLKLRRSKSFKENEAAVGDSELPTESTESPNAEAAPAPKKKFEFNFGTYPRAFRKKKPAEPVAVESSLGTEGLSVIPSTETQPSSTSSPQGDRGPGPVRSRWADKFSDVSYNDSEGSRYRRYGSELESFDRESSLERRMKEDLEDTGSEAQPQQQKLDLGILGGVADSKQFAEFDEENRAIHEISNLRSREFKRRPMVHQDSDLRSEDSRDAEGWTEKDIQKNKLLRKAELEAETGYYKYHSGEEGLLQDAQSTASSGKKVVMEEIDDDEFFLRKRGISEDNIQLRQYISAAIREGYDMPNALQNVGQEYGDYDVPPPKPRRLHKNYRPEYGDSQEFQRSDYGDDLSMSQNGSDFMPKRPLRKARSRSKYSMDSQDIPMADDGSQVQYFDDDEEYLRPPARDQAEVEEPQQGLNNLSFNAKASSVDVPRPHAPRRQKKRTRDQTSVEKEQADDFINGFGGRSVSNTFLQPQEDVIVYRTEHEYHIPLATPDNFTDGASARTQRSEDERTSRGADSLALDAQAPENELPQEVEEEPQHEKFVIDMLENDGYAVVRKEQMPKPTPPARRKKFTRSPGERFATLPSTRGSPPPPARPPPPQRYTPSDDSPLPPRRRSPSIEDIGLGAGIKSNEPSQAEQPVEEEEEEDDYEALERPESPRANLQSGDVINKMKYRPLPPPPRPPREKRQRGGSTVDSKGERTDDELSSYRYEDSERVASSSTADSYDQHEFEVEVSTQTDPLPDDFVCEEFEITEDMKVIEPRRSNGTKTLDDLLRSAQSEQDELDGSERPLTEDEQLARGLQRFRDANQRSMSERSRASSQADRSKSLSRPQTPSAVVIERRVPTPSPTGEENDSTVQAALIVRPISVADLEDDDLRREEEALRREGLLSDSSVQSKSDVETAGEDEELHGEQGHIALSDYAPSSADLDAAVEQLQQAQLESDYESKLEDDEVERTLRESEYEDDEVKGEKYSDHYDEDEELKLQEQVLRRELGLDLEQEQQLTDQEQQLTDQEQQLTDQELEEALEKELQEEMEKELAAYRKTEAPSSQIQELSSVEAVTTPEYPLSEEEPEEKIVTEEPLLSSEIATQLKSLPKVDTSEEVAAKFISSEPLDDEAEHEPPHPPPRRKSTTVLEPTSAPTLTIAEQATRELTPVQSVQSATTQPQAQLPSRLAELEVERLRVHALQAGQIMVSQLHGSQISSDELECKSGNLVVKNIELPPGFIEDIVERVRSSEPRASLLTTETQTSRQPSSEPAASEETDLEVEKPLKPPRQSKLTETAAPTTSSHSNLDEQTQTDAALLPLPPPPTVYPSVEYLQSLAPLAFYNLQRSGEAEQAADASPSSTADRKAPHKCRRRHVQRREEQYEDDEQLGSGSDLDVELVERPRSRRSRTRSGTQPSEAFDEHEPKTVVQAGRQFISACSLELVNIINQLTNYVRGDVVEQQQQQQGRNLPALMVLFILITFGVLVFLLTGRQVHTHHWDYFNPPGNEGRQT